MTEPCAPGRSPLCGAHHVATYAECSRARPFAGPRLCRLLANAAELRGTWLTGIAWRSNSAPRGPGGSPKLLFVEAALSSHLGACPGQSIPAVDLSRETTIRLPPGEDDEGPPVLTNP